MRSHIRTRRVIRFATHADLDIFRRRPEETTSYAGFVVSLCDEHGFPFWGARRRILNRWAATCQGEVELGIELLRDGVAAWRRRERAGGSRYFWHSRPRLTPRQPSDTALQVIAEAIMISEEPVNDGPSQKSCASRLASSWPPAARPRRSRVRPSTACRSLVISRPAPGSCAPPVIWLVFGNTKVAVRKLCSWYKRFTIRSPKASIPRISGTPKRCWSSWSARRRGPSSGRSGARRRAGQPTIWSPIVLQLATTSDQHGDARGNRCIPALFDRGGG